MSLVELREQLDRIEDCQSRIEKRQERIELLLTGNGEPAKGLVVRVDRLETFSRQSRWAFRTMITAALFAAGEFFWRLFHPSK